MSVRDLVLGFLRACYRFEAENLRSSDPEQEMEAKERARMALFEALNWADSVDQFLAHGSPDRGADPGWLDRLKVQEAQLIRGIQHARNAVHHQWWAAISIQIVLPTGKRKQGTTWIWSKLPPNNRDENGRKAYESALLGKPVVEALRTLRSALWNQRRWQITAADLDQPPYPPPNAPID